MVHFIVLIAALWTPPQALASQLDESLGPRDPPYFQAVSERFLSWSLRQYLPEPSPLERQALRTIQPQIRRLTSWSLPLTDEVSWPRFQFGLHFKNKKRTSVHLSIFPEETDSLAKDILKNYPGVSRRLLKNLVGFGFDTAPFRVFIYQKEDLDPKAPLGGIRASTKTILRKTPILGKTAPLILVQMEAPPHSPVPFTPLVERWAVWITGDGDIDSYQLDFRRFNVRILDDAAIFDAKKISSEFLMANLRLGYISNDDYQIQYP